MITFVEGDDIFLHDADIYVITVNTVGVMGAGLAKSFRERHPLLFEQYKRDCRAKRISIGNAFIYEGADDKRYLMFPTKTTFTQPSQYDFITAGLHWMVQAQGKQIDPDERIVMSPLGCHNGGLSFAVVSQFIATKLADMPNPITVVHPWYQPPSPLIMT